MKYETTIKLNKEIILPISMCVLLITQDHTIQITNFLAEIFELIEKSILKLSIW